MMTVVILAPAITAAVAPMAGAAPMRMDVVSAPTFTSMAEQWPSQHHDGRGARSAAIAALLQTFHGWLEVLPKSSQLPRSRPWLRQPSWQHMMAEVVVAPVIRPWLRQFPWLRR